MSNLVISLLFSAGASMWIFSKLQGRSGNNTRQSLTATGFSAAIIFIVLMVVLSLAF